jgi:hypothetical protein
MERLARYAVRSRDLVGRARREMEARVYVAHLQEALESYRSATIADSVRGSDGSHGTSARAARTHLLTLISGPLTHLCHNRLNFPPLALSDLPEDRRNAPGIQASRQNIWQSIGATTILIALATLVAWAGLPAEITVPLLVVLSGAMTAILPRARRPQ